MVKNFSNMSLTSKVVLRFVPIYYMRVPVSKTLTGTGYYVSYSFIHSFIFAKLIVKLYIVNFHAFDCREPETNLQAYWTMCFFLLCSEYLCFS